MVMAQVTEENIPSFIDAYNKAVEENQAYFIFEGQEILVKFAKYLIEYAEEHLNPKSK
jgi:hypothetical protein